MVDPVSIPFSLKINQKLNFKIIWSYLNFMLMESNEKINELYFTWLSKFSRLPKSLFICKPSGWRSLHRCWSIQTCILLNHVGVFPSFLHSFVTSFLPPSLHTLLSISAYLLLHLFLCHLLDCFYFYFHFHI